jgi:hypothetical protein
MVGDKFHFSSYKVSLMEDKLTPIPANASGASHVYWQENASSEG